MDVHVFIAVLIANFTECIQTICLCIIKQIPENISKRGGRYFLLDYFCFLKLLPPNNKCKIIIK